MTPTINMTPTYPLTGLDVPVSLGRTRGPSRQACTSALVFATATALHFILIALLVSLKVIQIPAQLSTLTVSLIQIAATSTPQARPPKPVTTPALKPVMLTTVPDINFEGDAHLVLSSESSALNSVSPAPTESMSVRTVTMETLPRFDAEYLDNRAPRYPAVSKRLREQGVAILRVRVETTGVPAEVLLHRSSGYAALDEAALSSVRQWKFVPARRGNDLVSAWVLVPIAFSLKM